MANDSATVRLLYAILSQKCLKDIDWNKVASDPILQQEITNGHAARMRYSRFKKQIEGKSTPRKPRNPDPPRKTKVEKKSARKVKKRSDGDDAEKIKGEVGVAGSSHRTPVTTPEAGLPPDSYHSNGEVSPLIKREPGSSNGSRYAGTPLESSPTPGSSFNGGAGDMSDMDEMLTSFNMPGTVSMYEPMMGQVIMTHQQYGLGMHMGLADSYTFWDQPQDAQADRGIPVKREPRWAQNYRQA